MSEPSLYEEHKKIHPKYQPGFFRTVRWWVSGIGLGIYFLLPWLPWSREGTAANQAVLLDIPGRKFYFFNLTFWPQDVILLALLLMVAAMALFFVTALAGRVFCGYFCIQTVWTDLFIGLEHLIDGHYKRRRRDVGQPMNVARFMRLLLKHGLWLLLSVAGGVAFVTYFADAATITGEILTGNAPEAAWWTVGIVAGFTYVFAGFAREQVCVYMCPYSRFQGVMFDPDTLIVAYDEVRGEPRTGNRRQRQGGGVGDCIDCKECVVACPAGIDIRQGQQYECITCAACIDACDSVMAKLNKPPGLVKYTSLNALSGGRTHLTRPRVLGYGAVLLLLFALMVGYILSVKELEITVMRQRQPLYIHLSSGGIQNNYLLRVLNMTAHPREYRLKVEGAPGLSMEISSPSGRDDQGWPHLQVGAGEAVPFDLYLRQEKGMVKPGDREVMFTVTAVDSPDVESRYQSVFLAPGE